MSSSPIDNNTCCFLRSLQVEELKTRWFLQNTLDWEIYQLNGLDVSAAIERIRNFFFERRLFLTNIFLKAEFGPLNVQKQQIIIDYVSTLETFGSCYLKAKAENRIPEFLADFELNEKLLEIARDKLSQFENTPDLTEATSFEMLLGTFLE